MFRHYKKPLNSCRNTAFAIQDKFMFNIYSLFDDSTSDYVPQKIKYITYVSF